MNKQGSATKHTPGPWTDVDYRSGERRGWVYGADRTAVAEVHATSLKSEHAARIEANARLIAAAPSLLEAAQNIAEEFEFGRTDASGEPDWEAMAQKMYDLARAAISAATEGGE